MRFSPAGEFGNGRSHLCFAACSDCCSVIVDDDEGANRRQHESWHNSLAASAVQS